MDNGAKVDDEKVLEWHEENFPSFAVGSDDSICPKNEHEQGRSKPNGDSRDEDEFQHEFYSPFVFYIYNTIYDC